MSASHPCSSLLRWLCHLQIHSLCSEVPVLQSTLCIFPVEVQNLISPFFSLGKYTRISGSAERAFYGCFLLNLSVLFWQNVSGENSSIHVLHDGCVTSAYSISFGNKTNKETKWKASDSDHLHAVLALKASLPTARSENGFIHVWNLKTHRVDTALDGHGRKSVYCVETMGGKDRLLRLAKQAKTSEITLVSCLRLKEKKGGRRHKGFS